MLLKREIHWIFTVFDRSRTDPLGSRAEEQDTGRAASLRRSDGFGAGEAAPPGAAGFGRRKTPIPETTDGMPPRSAANDHAARDDRDDAGASAGASSHDLSGEFVAWLRTELRQGREVQHEAVLCALGALAGYAAQQAIRETLVKTGKLAIDQAFAVIETRSGDVFFFGDLLNEVIVDKHRLRGEGHASIWKLVSEGGYEAGAINLPDVNDVIKHSAATVGSEEFGIPRVPDAHMPAILPREAVGRFWPAARRRLAGAEPMSWPLHFALAARQLIVELKHLLRPDIAVQIVMEAAVPMSKIDPMTLPRE
jgi:hypothetical protein